MVNRDQVIAYLLHQLPETERAAFAERWFNDPELYEELQAAEAALLDDYVQGRLSEERRRQVEQSLLASEIQRCKLEFSAALQAALTPKERAQPPWVLLALAALLVISTGISFWFGVENRRLNRDVARLENSVPAQSGSVYTLDLPSDTSRGASPQITARLAPGASVVRLELELRPGDESRLYSATVSLGARTVWTEAPVRAEAQSGVYLARVWIPSAELAPGEYTVRLDSSGTPVAYYRFSITR
jgi:hypothetical protein